MAGHRTDVPCVRDRAARIPSDSGESLRARQIFPALIASAALALTPTTAHADTNVQAFSTAVPTWTLAQLYDFRQLSGFVEQTAGWSMSDWYDFQVFVAGQEFNAAHDGAAWDRVAWCEERGDWTVVGSRYSGGLGFANSTWNAWGGRQYATYAGQATREEQILVADSHVDQIGQRSQIEAARSDCAGYHGW